MKVYVKVGILAFLVFVPRLMCHLYAWDKGYIKTVQVALQDGLSKHTLVTMEAQRLIQRSRQ